MYEKLIKSNPVELSDPVFSVDEVVFGIRFIRKYYTSSTPLNNALATHKDEVYPGIAASLLARNLMEKRTLWYDGLKEDGTPNYVLDEVSEGYATTNRVLSMFYKSGLLSAYGEAYEKTSVCSFSGWSAISTGLPLMAKFLFEDLCDDVVAAGLGTTAVYLPGYWTFVFTHLGVNYVGLLDVADRAVTQMFMNTADAGPYVDGVMPGLECDAKTIGCIVLSSDRFTASAVPADLSAAQKAQTTTLLAALNASGVTRYGTRYYDRRSTTGQYGDILYTVGGPAKARMVKEVVDGKTYFDMFVSGADLADGFETFASDNAVVVSTSNQAQVNALRDLTDLCLTSCTSTVSPPRPILDSLSILDDYDGDPRDIELGDGMLLGEAADRVDAISQASIWGAPVQYSAKGQVVIASYSSSDGFIYANDDGISISDDDAQALIGLGASMEFNFTTVADVLASDLLTSDAIKDQRVEALSMVRNQASTFSDVFSSGYNAFRHTFPGAWITTVGSPSHKDLVKTLFQFYAISMDQ